MNAATRAGRMLVAMVITSTALAVVVEHAAAFDINPWPDGIIPYRFDDGTLGPVAVQTTDVAKIERQMARWERAFTLTDPSGDTKKYFDFIRCSDYFPVSHLVIRYNQLDSSGIEIECNNMSEPVGMEFMDPDGHPENRDDDGITELNFRRGTCPRDATASRPALPIAASKRTNQDDNTILHELGHVLGLWHEFNRTDADAYLMEQPNDLDGDAFSDPKAFNTRSATLMPLLGNYDYDSLMAYAGQHDLLDNAFSRQSAQDKTEDPANVDPHGDYIVDYSISPGVKSRLLQYYAYGYNQNWGFFCSLSPTPPPVAGNDDTDLTLHRNPYLARGVSPVGTPAIAFESEGNYDVFARGSDDGLYWKMVRGNVQHGWVDLGCCFGSDPAAISLGDGQIDVFAVGATSGKVMRKSYRNDQWGAAVYIQGGYPSGGIKQTADGGYLGPGVASRGPNMLDVFVVRSDGRLAVTTLNNGSWSVWRTLGSGYDVTARPAAVALSATQVQLAINESDFSLYEPLVTFGQNVSFNLGDPKGVTAPQAPPALTKRDDADNPYRVLVTNADGRISHRFAHGSWRDIGGMPKPGTGPSAVAAGPSSAYIVINGADLVGCDATCDDPNAPTANGTFIEPGGLWVRYFR